MDTFRYLFFYLSSFRKAPWETGISPPELLEYIGTHPAGRALDLGCGTGTNVIALAKAGWQTWGVDYISRSIQRARKKAEENKVSSLAHFSCDSVTRLNDIQGTFDLILDMGCYQGLSTRDKLIYQSNVDKLLSSHGVLMMYGKVRTDTGEFGFCPEDEAAFSRFAPLIHRQEGTDRSRRSVWLWFQRD